VVLLKVDSNILVDHTRPASCPMQYPNSNTVPSKRFFVTAHYQTLDLATANLQYFMKVKTYSSQTVQWKLLRCNIQKFIEHFTHSYNCEVT